MKKSKKTFAVILLCLLFSSIACGCARTEEKKYDNFLRLHIRANSNEPPDREAKLLVRDKTVEFLAPVLKNAKNADEAEKLISGCSNSLKKVAENVLSENGFSYSAKIKTGRERFPLRTYGELALPSGIYRCVIIELGEAAGDNWWCVCFPPLCFIGDGDAGSGDIEYKSLIGEWLSGGKRK